MMASMCLLARLPATAFGVSDELDLVLIGDAMIDLLREHASKVEMQRQLSRLNGT